MPGSFYTVTLELDVFSLYHTGDQQFYWWSFGVSANPDAELNFLFDFKVEKVSAFMCIAEFLDLMSDIWNYRKVGTFLIELDLFFRMGKETEQIEHEISLMACESSWGDDEDSGLVKPVLIFNGGECLIDFCHCWYYYKGIFYIEI